MLVDEKVLSYCFFVQESKQILMQDGTWEMKQIN